VLLPVRNPHVSVWAGLLVCAYPVIEVIYSVVRRAIRHQSPGAPDSGHLHSLIKVKLIRPKLASHDITKSMRNAAVSPIVWTFSSVPAIAATAVFDRPVLLAAGILVSTVAYHAFYTYLTRKGEAVHAGIDTSPSFTVSQFKKARVHIVSRRHRARGHRSSVAR
jgi:hypothetical protein